MIEGIIQRLFFKKERISMKHRLTLFSALLLFISQMMLPATSLAIENTSLAENTTDTSANGTESYTHNETEATQTSTTSTSSSIEEERNELTEKQNVEQEPALLNAATTDGIAIKPNYTENATFNGGKALLYTINIQNTAIAKGQVLTFAFSDPSIISTITPNSGAGAQYGNWSVDLAQATATFTFTMDILETSNITILLNATTKNVTSQNNKFTASLDQEPFFTSIFNTNYANPGGGGSYNGRMMFPGVGTVVSTATKPEGFLANSIPGTNQFIPSAATMELNVIYDAGFYNNSKKDVVNRKVTLKFQGEGATLTPENIYFSNKYNLYPNTSTGYVTLASLGMTTQQIDASTVEISLPDGADQLFSWGYFYLMAGAPSTSASYLLTASYTSDIYTEASSTTTGSLTYQNTGNKGFIPTITTKDKNLNTNTTVTNLQEWLLEGVTATDVEDGDLSNKVTVLNDGGLEVGWNQKIPGQYTVTYQVVDSDGNTVTATALVTIYADITVNYQDSSGSKIKASTTLTGNAGDVYTIDTADIIFSGKKYYYVSADPNTLTGIYGQKGQATEITLTYAENQQSITGADYTMYVGDPTPTVTDFQAAATDKTGASATVNADLSQADISKAGDYKVTLTSSDNQSTIVNLHVLANQQSITGKDYTMYVGDPTPTAADFQAVATDKAGASVTVNADLSQADISKTGDYKVTLTSSDNQSTIVNLHVLANQQSITGKDYTMYAGDPTPTAADFQAIATDKTGAPVTVNVDLSQADISKAGDYKVTLTSSDHQSKIVNLHVLDQPAIEAADKTMYVGDTLTKKMILNWATFSHADGLVQGFEIIGEPIPVSSSDLLTTAGTYKINYYIQGKARDTDEILAKKEITLTVLEKKTEKTDPTIPTKTISSGTNVKPAESTLAGKGLPNTGEQQAVLLYVLGGTLIILDSVGYSWVRKEKKSN